MQVLKTKPLTKEKVTLLKKRQINCLFGILSIFSQLLLFQLREHLTALFMSKILKPYKRRSLYIVWDIAA
jgi:hypothetical protein